MLSSYGHDVAVGDFDGNGISDFAISAPLWSSIGQNDFILPNIGKVELIYSDAITTQNDQLVISKRAMPCAEKSILNGHGMYKQFGYALASNDIDRDGCDDLFVSV